MDGQDRRLMWLLSLTLALSLVGYPITASVAALIGVENATLNYPFRSFVALISGLSILLALTRGIFRITILITTFLFIYSIRLIVDISVIPHTIIERDATLFLAALLIPALAMGSSWRNYQEQNAGLVLAGFGTLACSFIVLTLLNGIGVSGNIDFGSRNWLENLNPITIAYTGIWTAIAAYSVRRSFSASVNFLILWPIIGLGIATFLLGGSRGPIIGLALFFGLHALIKGRAALSTVLFSGSVIAIAIQNFADLAIFQRFSNLTNDPSVLERLIVIDLSLNQGINSPLWGSSYLELTTLSYPHNLLIEAFMALGVIGGLAMLAMQIQLFRHTITLMRNGYFLLPALSSMSLANAWISGSIFGSSDFFILAVASSVLAESRRVGLKDQHRDQNQKPSSLYN